MKIKSEIVFSVVMFCYIICFFVFGLAIFKISDTVKEYNNELSVIKRDVQNLIYTKETLIMIDSVTNETIRDRTIYNGVYSVFNDIYCVNPAVILPRGGNVTKTEMHEHAHYLIDQKFDHFCSDNLTGTRNRSNNYK